MAGATNRQLKTAGIPKAAMAQIRVHAGGRLTLKSALDVAARHGIAVPDKAHAFMVARDLKTRKAALRAAGARRSATVTRAIGDASKVALAARKEAAQKKNVTAAVDGKAKGGKRGAMGATREKTIKLNGDMTRAQTDALRAIGILADVRGGNPITSRARDRRDLAAGRGRHTSYVAVLSKKDGSSLTTRDVEHARAAIETAK